MKQQQHKMKCSIISLTQSLSVTKIINEIIYITSFQPQLPNSVSEKVAWGGGDLRVNELLQDNQATRQGK